MNKDAQRVAILEAMGWTDAGHGVGPNLDLWLGNKPVPGGLLCDQRCSDPLNDLNAAHEALRVLHKDEILWAKYREYMYRFYLANDTFPPTAEQICEGVLRTLNLWSTDNTPTP